MRRLLPCVGHSKEEMPVGCAAVIGCGYWGQNIVRVMGQLGALAAVSDADPERAAEKAMQFGVKSMSFDEVLSSDIPAVMIASPAVTHYRLVNDALLAGKHVFVEKPLSLEVREAQELAQLAEAKGLVLMVGHLLQYHPAYLALKDLVRGGRLGQLQYIHSTRVNFGKFRREENALWSFAPHDVSIILDLVGTEPSKVDAVGSYYLNQDVADITTTHLSFSNGVAAHVFVSWLNPYKEQKLAVIGSQGMAVFDDGQPWEQKLLYYPHQLKWSADGGTEASKADPRPIEVEKGEPLKLECQHFLECIRSGKQPQTNGREGLKVLRVLDAAQRSLSQARGKAQPHSSRIVSPIPVSAMVHESAYIDENVMIGEGTRVWHFSHLLPNTHVGRNVNIGQNVVAGPNVTIGDNCKIQNNVSIYKGVTLEGGVFCGPSCVFTNVLNPRAEIDRKSDFKPTLVKRGATIGANATIVCGHTLGEYCFIAAGAVVASDVPPHALMAGVPARQIGWMSAAGERLGKDLVCPRDGVRYELCEGNRLIRVKS